MKKRSLIINQKIPVFVFCEGLTEVQLFRFLKHDFDKKIHDIRPVEDLGGVGSLVVIQKKYKEKIKKIKQNYGSDISVLMLFIVDGDLIDSAEIKKFLLAEGCLVEQSVPNTEGMLLSLVGKSVVQDVPLMDFRGKCKNKFKNHFGCTADKLDEKSFQAIFKNITIVGANFPIVKTILDPN